MHHLALRPTIIAIVAIAVMVATACDPKGQSALSHTPTSHPTAMAPPTTSGPVRSGSTSSTTGASQASGTSGTTGTTGTTGPPATLPPPSGGTNSAGAAADLAGLPDPSLTPGAVDPRVTPATLGSTICRSGYTRTVRPPSSYTESLKRQGLRAYGRQGRLSDYQEDHLVALEIGGSATDPRNLWPEPLASAPEAKPGLTAAQKDPVENAAHSAVCAGRLPLADAQRLMATDWVDLGRRLGVL